MTAMINQENKRVAIPKSIRFEVFKRDSFTCQYCGESAPNVILNVDHIYPVSKGGNNEIMNLVTSCEDCNSGKSDKLLTDTTAINKQKAQLDELNGKRLQLEMMIEWRESLKDFDTGTAQKIAEYFESEANCGVNDFGIKNIKKRTKKFTYQVMGEAQ